MKKKVLFILSFVFLATISFAQDVKPQQYVRQDAKEITNKHILDQLSNEYESVNQIVDNTSRSWKDYDYNFYGWIAMIIAILSFIVSYVTYREQKQTEQHTSNTPIDVQLWKLKDLPRHFYRNLVCTSAFIYMFKQEGEEKKRKRYPSESHLGKLETLPDDVVLPIDVDETEDPNKNPYKYMHELKLLIRNYNVEVRAALKHISRKDISDASLKQDYDNLLFKPINLVTRTFDFEKSLIHQKNKKSFIKRILTKTLIWMKLKSPKEIFLGKRTIKLILAEHFRKLYEKSNFLKLFNGEYSQKYLNSLLLNSQNDFKIFIEGKEPDEEGALDWSIDGLIKYEKDSANEDEKSKKEHNISEIGSKAIMDEVTKVIGKDEIMQFVNGKTEKHNNEEKIISHGLFTIKDAKDFAEFCKEREFEKSKKDCNELYKNLKPYFNYLQQEKWDTKELIKCILAIDAAIETSRIGMVNYE